MVIFLVVEGLASVLMALNDGGWWLLNVGVAVAVSKQKTTVKFALTVDFLSQRISLACGAI